MSPFSILLAVGLLSTSLLGTPIVEGDNVGTVRKVRDEVIVDGQTKFPFMVRIDIQTTEGFTFCGGVLIGRGVILTAAHCLSGKVLLRLVASAGFVDTHLDLKFAQRKLVKDYLIHGSYKSRCRIGKNRSCYYVNDIAILWTKREFNLGPKVQIAQLNENLNKPVGQTGWIIGWGWDGKENPSMLQKGQVRATSEETCRKFNPTVYITQNVMCVSPITGITRIAEGDSGGPLVINGVVYGIGSATIFGRGTLDMFTYVAKYHKWISDNLNAGPPTSVSNQLPTRVPTTSL